VGLFRAIDAATVERQYDMRGRRFTAHLFADRLGLREADIGADGRVACCGSPRRDDHIERAIAWLGRHGMATNPGQEAWHLYYLYGVERVGRLSGRRFLDRLDWYRTGADLLVARQDSLNGQWRGSGILESDPVLATAFSLLFLGKGRRPILISQLDWRDDADSDWNRHPSSLHQLTRDVEVNWKRDLAWQTIRLKLASIDDLAETPVLFVRGTQALDLPAERVALLREYVRQGGFLWVEACDGDGCRGEAFAKSFERLASELIPNAKLRALPIEHPIWYAETRVDPKSLPEGFWIHGVDACCRTSIVFTNRTLSCYWELRSDRSEARPGNVERRIRAALDVGRKISSPTPPIANSRRNSTNPGSWPKAPNRDPSAGRSRSRRSATRAAPTTRPMRSRIS